MEKIHLNETLDEIIKELDEKNLLYLTSSKIKELKNNILQKLLLSRDELLKYHKTLKEYRYVDEVDEIKIGSYIRWFNLKQIKEIKLTNGGIIIDIKNGKEENYKDLVFHGPLQATLLLRASEKLANKKAKKFIHKGHAPVFANEYLKIQAILLNQNEIDSFTSTKNSGLTMSGKAYF